MSAPAVLPHRDAVLASLAAAGLVVGKGVKPASIPASGAYAVLYTSAGMSEPESLADARTDFSALVQVTCCGPTEEVCLWVADKVRAALHGELLVAGRMAYRPDELGGPPIARDDDVSPPVYFMPIQYMIRSILAQ